RGLLEVEPIARDPARSESEAAARARSAGAGLVLIATLEPRPAERLRGVDLEAIRCHGEVRAIDAQERTRGRGSADGWGFAATATAATLQAMNNVARSAAQAALDEATAGAEGTRPSAQHDGGLLVHVAGLSGLRDADDAQQELTQLPGI